MYEHDSSYSSVDVVVCISLGEKFCCECLWFVFGSDTTISYLGATAMSQELGLPALTGCDVTLSVAGKVKLSNRTAGNSQIMPHQLDVQRLYTIQDANNSNSAVRE